MNKNKLRGKLVREIMPRVKAEEDYQALVIDIINDDRIIIAFPENEAAIDFAYSIIRFCEHACGFTK